MSIQSPILQKSLATFLSLSQLIFKTLIFLQNTVQLFCKIPLNIYLSNVSLISGFRLYMFDNSTQVILCLFSVQPLTIKSKTTKKILEDTLYHFVPFLVFQRVLPNNLLHVNLRVLRNQTFKSLFTLLLKPTIIISFFCGERSQCREKRTLRRSNTLAMAGVIKIHCLCLLPEVVHLAFCFTFTFELR